MTREFRPGSRSETSSASAKRLWTQPKIETVPGRGAAAVPVGNGGVDYGTYS